MVRYIEMKQARNIDSSLCWTFALNANFYSNDHGCDDQLQCVYFMQRVQEFDYRANMKMYIKKYK